MAQAADALGRAQDQQTAGVQGVVHQRQELLLRLGIDVDQEVSTTEDVELRERRIDEDVLRRKDHQVADFFLDPVALALADENRASRSGDRSAAMLAENVPWRAFSMASWSMSVAKIWIVERNSFRWLSPGNGINSVGPPGTP